MIIIQKDSESYKYKGKLYRYGVLSLNFINYKREDTNNKNLFISFKDDFKSNFRGDNYDNLSIFSDTYQKLLEYTSEISLLTNNKPTKQDYVSKNKKILKLLQTPYLVYMHHDFKTSVTQLEFKRFQDFLIFDLYHFCNNNTFIMSCPGCNNLFIKKTWGEHIYCSSTCRNKYSNKLFEKRIKQSPVIQKYYTLRKRYYMRTSRNPEQYSNKTYLNWNDTALKLKNEKKYYELEEFLKHDPFSKDIRSH